MCIAWKARILWNSKRIWCDNVTTFLSYNFSTRKVNTRKKRGEKYIEITRGEWKKFRYWRWLYLLTYSTVQSQFRYWRWLYLLTYLLTPRCRVLLDKLTGLQLVKKFPAFYETRRFITALTSVRHLSLSWASRIQSIYPHPTSWRSILILSIHLRLGLPSGLLPSGFLTKTLYTPPLLTHMRHMPSPSHSSRFYLKVVIWLLI